MVCSNAQTRVNDRRILISALVMNRHDRAPERESTMLYTIAVILLVAWLLGIAGTYTIGAFVHVLLVVAVVLFVVGLLSGRRTLA